MQEYLLGLSIEQLHYGLVSELGIFYDLTQCYNVTREDANKAAIEVLKYKIAEFAKTINSKYIDLIYRANHLEQFIGTDKFITEYKGIKDGIDSYDMNLKKCDLRRARRYAMKNRIDTLLYENRYYDRCIGYVINAVDGREDEQLIKTLQDIATDVAKEFGKDHDHHQ